MELSDEASERVACPGCGATLKVPGTGGRSDDALIGRTLGRYEILERVGSGGMGTVYRARQAAVDRICAVKVLPRSVAGDPSFVERFFREGRAAAAVNHPNIVQVYDTGYDEGLYYIAMEFVEGEHLGAALKREGPLPPETAFDAMKQVASALAAAHELGIVHRDIKPSNILRMPDGRVKVADFGLAKREGVDATVTAAGARLGTPLYFPPEVARGAKADARSDLYSLGATFYHLVAGRSPFDAPSVAGIVMKHLEGEVPPLDEAVPGAPRALVRAIHRLLSKDPAERYQTAGELLDALEGTAARPAAGSMGAAGAKAATGHRTIEERREAMRQRKRRNALLAAAGAALLILLLILILALGRG